MVILGFDVVKAFTPDVSLFEMVARRVIMGNGEISVLRRAGA